MVAHHQGLDVRQVVALDEPPLHLRVDVPGDEQVIVPGGDQVDKTPLVGAVIPQGRIDGEGGFPQGESSLLRNEADLGAVGLRRGQDRRLGVGVAAIRRAEQGLRPHPLQKALDAGDMVIIVVGQEKVAELAAAGALQGLRRDAAGVLPAVETAAVRQGEVALGGEDDALALAHVQDLGVEAAVGVAQGPQVHGVEEAGGGKPRREEPFPLPLLPGEPGNAEEQVEEPQPVLEVGIAEIKGVVGDPRQEPRHPEEVADQKPRQEGQDRPQGQPEEAQRHRQQPAAEDEPHAPETEEIADR